MTRIRCLAAAGMVAAMIGATAASAVVTPPALPPSPPMPPGVPGEPGAPGAPPMPDPPAMPKLPPVPMGRYTLADVAFFAGRWRGATDGSVVEEHWSAPEGSSMVGMFRWVAPGGAPYMFQLMTLTEEGGGVIMRVREFSEELVAKEEKDKPKVLRLVEVEGEKASFAPEDDAEGIDRVIYERPSPDTLTFTVTFPESAKREPFRLSLVREGSAPTATAPAPTEPAESPEQPAPVPAEER
jgi:hypothetical protein